MIRRLRVIKIMAAARQHLGARIEIRALLNDDAGALAAVFVAADEHGIAARVDGGAALG